MNSNNPSNPTPVLKAPFPAFGGKSRVAAEVWRRFGGVDDPVRNYVEPFCFSSAVLLRRPTIEGDANPFGTPGAVETINDRNAFVSNFWRAVRADPDAVAFHTDWPVNETDLHARQRWLVASDRATAQLQRVRDDPEFFDVKIAGWWCWGMCCWIGSGWCDETHRNSSSATRPGLGGQVVTAGPVWDGSARRMDGNADGLGGGIARNVKSGPRERRPGISQDWWGVNAGGSTSAQVPCLSASQGINSPDDTHRPQLADAFGRGRGVHGHDAASACEDRRAWTTGWMRALADRLLPVRVCCGHWSRVCDSPSTMTRLGTTGVFLDPPYRITLGDGTANRTRHIYANDRHQDVNALCDEVQEWCLRWGQEKGVRIALCGLEGEYPAIDALTGTLAWDKFEWKSNGGYGNQSVTKKNENAARERIWFSPWCVKPRAKEVGLFT